MSLSGFPDRTRPIQAQRLVEMHPAPIGTDPGQLLRLAEERWRAGCGCSREQPPFDACWLICSGRIRLQTCGSELIIGTGGLALLPAGLGRTAQVHRDADLHLLVVHADPGDACFATGARVLEALPVLIEDLLRGVLETGVETAAATAFAQSAWRTCRQLLQAHLLHGDSAAGGGVRTYRACRQRIAGAGLLTSAAEAARLCAIDVDHLNRLFRRHAGETCSAWLRRRRLQQAAALLARTGCGDLAAIASTCGYADAFSFSKAFKRHFGLSPSRWYATVLSEHR